MSRLSYKSLILILLFLLIPIVLFFRISQRSKQVSAEWFNDSWNYRVSVNIGNTSGSDLTNQRVKINIDTSALFNAGKIQSNCNDIRVTDNNGNLLDHWHTNCNTVSTNIYIKTSNIPTSGSDLYIYYGNPSATKIEKALGTNENPGTSCKMMKDQGSITSSGIYYVAPGGNDDDKVQVYCDVDIISEAWTLVMNNGANVIPPKPTWEEAINNNNITGSISDNLNTFDQVLGLKHWNYLGDNALIQMGPSPSTITKRAHYSSFSLDSSNNYLLSLGGQTVDLGGTTPGFYATHNNKQFTTFDADHDSHASNCSTFYSNTPWWYVACWSGNLWGGGDVGGYQNKPFWIGASTDYYDFGGIYIGGSDSMKNTSVTVNSEEVGGGPVAYWKFDEGVGTTAYDSIDSSPASLQVGASAPSWVNEDQCISGKCLDFKGSNNYVYPVSVSKLNNLEIFTLSAWVNMRNRKYIPTIINKGPETAAQHIWWGIQSNNQIWLELGDSGSYSTYKSTALSWDLNKWYYLAVSVNNETKEIKHYRDGKLINTLSFSGRDFNSGTYALSIGRYYSNSPTNYDWDGFLDEVKIYPYARTANQIKADYAAGLAGMGTSSDSTVNIGGQSAKSLSDGLVGYWKFDEGVGTTTADSSGNNNLATFGAGDSAPSWSSGKYGIGVSFNASNSYATTTNMSYSPTPGRSGCAWIKPTAHTNNLAGIFRKVGGGGPSIRLTTSGYFNDRVTNTAGGVSNAYTSSSAVSTGTWSHVCVVWESPGPNQNIRLRYYINSNLDLDVETNISDPSGYVGSNNTNPTWIGSDPDLAGRVFNGLIDEIRIYNRALNPTEVKQLYEYAPGPVAYYNFEEGQGTTITDRSGNNFSSTSTTGTPVWVNGKYGTAASFNGSTYSQFPSLGTGSYAGTTSIWINFPANYSANTAISNIGPFFIGSTSANRLNFDINRGGTWVDGSWGTATNFYVNNIPANTWTYVTVTWDSGTAKVFINGILKLTKNYTTGPLTNNGGNWLGHWNNGNNYTGKVDEIKIYNYARTQKQILEDMNAGAPATSARGGPLVHYKFDESKGTTVANHGFGKNHNATINGSNWSFSQGKVGKGLKVSTNQESSFINYMVWKDGQTGSVTGFNRNGNDSENYRIIDTDPWGRKVVVWEARPDAISGADGGWNGSTFTIDNSKLYRFSVWINRTVTGNGSAYFGTHGYGSINAIYVRGAGTTTTNPYFYSGTPGQNVWTLFVGHVWPAGSGTGSQHTDSGRYTISGGKIGAVSNDFVWLPENTTTHLRTYLYYSTDTNTRQQWIYPRVDIVDGTEPSIQDLLDGYGAYGDDVLLQTSDSPETVTLWYDKNSTGSWQHLAKSGSSYYVNGKIATPDEYPVYTSGQDIYFGRTTASDFVSGLIDEVKIYNYALSADEVKQDYNQGSTFVFGSSNQTIGATTTSLDYCIPGDTSPCSPPVAEWKFEEGVGTTAYDTSGNNFHGIFGAGSSAPSWNNGKIGTAVFFDGTPGKHVTVSAGSGNSNNFTVQAWVKPTSYTGSGNNNDRNTILYANNKYLQIYSNGKIAVYINSLSSPGYHYSNATVPLNQWSHVAYNYNGSEIRIFINGSLDSSFPATGTPPDGWVNATIGFQDSSYQRQFDGSVDQVRIYNYARTPAQIAYDYNKGAPVGHWKMDECQGTQIADWSGNNNHGTLSIGASGTQTSPGTCTTSGTAWYNGKLGKLNASINFDGSDDFVTVTNADSLKFGTNDFTISLWTFRSSTGVQGGAYISKGAYTVGFDTYDNIFRVNTSNGELARVTLNATLNTWQNHTFVVTQNSTPYIKHYINGVFNNSGYSAAGNLGSFNSDNYNLLIGKSTAGGVPRHLPGQIDDVRIYNYALTQTQIKTIYNNGSVNFR